MENLDKLNIGSIDKILVERLEQLHKHGYDVNWDLKHNTEGSLIMAAIYCLTLDEEKYPLSWNDVFKNRMKSKALEERLIIAAALLAAEYDRLAHKKSHILTPIVS